MSRRSRITRREFLHASAVVAAGAVSAACAVPATPTKEATATAKPEEPTATPKPAAKYKESPMLKELVESGELPSLDERIPTTPFVVGPGVLLPKDEIDFEVGRYGGTLRVVHYRSNWNPDVFVMNNEPLVMGPSIYGRDIRPSIVKDFEISEDSKVFTFHMRKGLKWSDGTPVTTEDVLFAYEDVLMNEKLTPTFPQWMRSGNSAEGEPMELEVIDDYTFRISFTDPYGGFLTQMAIVGWRGYTDLLKPKHHLKQFHADYVPMEELGPLIEEEELTEGEWWTLFHQKDVPNWDVCDKSKAIDFPTLCPWMMVRATPQLVEYERNPYYFKVDEEGNQLPYIDKIRDPLVADPEARTMKVLTGEVDFLYEAGALPDVPTYRENEEEGGYRTVILRSHTEPATVYINLTYDDPAWRQMVRDVRFRRALNMSLNREEIIDSVWLGFGAELPEKIPSVYDPEKANQLLDEIGLDKRDEAGWRLGPDGERFTVPFEISARTAEMVPTTELVVEYFKEVGLKTTMKTIDTSLRSTREEANELKATVERCQQPLWWNRARSGVWYSSTWCPLWDLWRRTAGEEGEEPPEEVKRFFELTGRSIVVGPDERPKVIEEYSEIQYENIFFITPVERERRPVIASNKLGNVAHDGFSIAACFAGEQFFFKE